jgi:hypothetical protein
MKQRLAILQLTWFILNYYFEKKIGTVAIIKQFWEQISL